MTEFGRMEAVGYLALHELPVDLLRACILYVLLTVPLVSRSPPTQASQRRCTGCWKECVQGGCAACVACTEV
jgi:hypothetical protein